MNARMKLATACVVGAILVTGCGQSNTGSAGTSPGQPAAASSVDGYKSFKFGMKPSELAKLAECAPNDYDEKIAAEIVELEDRVESKKSILGVARSAGRSSSFEEELLAELEKHLEDLKNIDNKEINYRKALHCELNFGGKVYDVRMNGGLAPEPGFSSILNIGADIKTVVFHFNKQEQLGAVRIRLGDFNQEKLNSLLQEIQVKYPLSSTPSDVDIATANGGEGSTVSWFFANNGVELRLLSAGATKLMVLFYHDAISAKEAFNASQKGKVSSGDL